jgi:hypothetical protein
MFHRCCQLRGCTKCTFQANTSDCPLWIFATQGRSAIPSWQTECDVLGFRQRTVTHKGGAKAIPQVEGSGVTWFGRTLRHGRRKAVFRFDDEWRTRRKRRKHFERARVGLASFARHDATLCNGSRIAARRFNRALTASDSPVTSQFLEVRYHDAGSKSQASRKRSA